MRNGRDVDQLLVTWLDGDASSGTAAYLEETLELLDRTPQRRAAGVLRRALPTGRLFPAVPPRLVQLAILALLGVALLAAALIVGSRPRPAPPIGIAGNGSIAFSNGTDSFLLDPFSDDAPKALPGGLGSKGNATFSPDGTLVAFFSKDPAFGHAGGPYHPFVGPADGSQPARQISDGIVMWDPVYVAPTWSPDGTRIAFNGYDIAANDVGIAVAHVDGSGTSLIVEGGYNFAYADPAWSPDGRWIAYRDASSEIEGTALMVVPADGGEPLRILSAADKTDSFGRLDWSPDGARLAYERRRSPEPGDFQVATVELASRKQRIISPDGVPSFEPVWSPDGRSLAYIEDPPGESGTANLVVVDRDGANRVELGPTIGCMPQWSPDGQYLFGYKVSCNAGLIVVPVANPAAAREIDAPGLVGTLSWQRVAP